MRVRRAALRRGLKAALGIVLLLACAAAEERLVVRGRLAGADARGTEPPMPVGARRIGTDVRDALSVAADSSFEVAVRDRDAELLFSIAVSAPASCRIPVRFRIEARSDADWEPLFDERMPAGQPRWMDHAVALDRARRPRRLRFSTGAQWPGFGALACARLVHPLWGSVLFLGADDRGPSPNVVLISLDTLGAAYLSAFGNAPGVSPHLDAFLAEGFSLRRAYAQYGVTRTSHASLFTGLHPIRHGAYPFEAVLPLESLVAPLARSGYLTAAFTEGGFVSGALGFQRGFDRYDDGTRRAIMSAAHSDVDETLRRASDWLRRTGSRTRFFLFLHSYEVHAPYRPRDDGALAILGRLAPESPPASRGKQHMQMLAGHNDGTHPLDSTWLAQLRALHAAEIHYLDRAVARLLAHLDRLGLSGDTLVVLTADHGDQFGEHGKVGHGESLHNRVLHVPLGFRWPGAIAPGVSDAPVQLVDVMPTVLDLVGVAVPAGLDGRSLAPLMRGAALEERPAFAEMRSARGECRRLGLPARCRLDGYAVQTGRFKLVTSRVPAREALYDLREDPLELRDVAADHPDELARHRALLAAYRRAAPSRPGGEASALQLDAQLREQLRALGYLE